MNPYLQPRKNAPTRPGYSETETQYVVQVRYEDGRISVAAKFKFLGVSRYAGRNGVEFVTLVYLIECDLA